MILVLDVGGTMIKYAKMDPSGKRYEQGSMPTPQKDQKSFFEALDTIILPNKESIEGIAVSMPGTIDPDSGMIRQGGALTYHTKTNVKELMKQRYKLPVEIENDAKCAAIAEVMEGNLRGIHQGVVLTFGTGIGGCFVINGAIYHGAHHIAGEVSMMLTKDIRKYKGDALWGSAAQGSIPGLLKRICEAKGVETATGPEVFSWIACNDEIACAMFQEYCEQMVTQLFNLQLVMDPKQICIGGGVSQNPIFITGIQQAMQAFYDRLPLDIPRMEIVACHFYNDANLIGAYHHYQSRQKEKGCNHD